MAKKLLKRRVLRGLNNLITDNAATTRHYSILSDEDKAYVDKILLSDVDERTDHDVSTTDNTTALQEQLPRKKLNLREETLDNSQSNASTRAAILNQGEEYLADMMREQGTERSDAVRHNNQTKEEALAADEYHKYDQPGTVYEGKGKVSYTLPEITVNAKGPTDWMGISYAAHTSPLALRMEADRNQAGMDMYNAMLGIASLPYAGAFQFGNWLKWGLPKLGVSRVPTAVAGWGANALLSGYFGYHGAKGLYDAWQHPETLSNPYALLRLGADALMAIAPFGDVIGGVSKLPTAWRYARRYYGAPAANYLSNTRVGLYIPKVSQMLNARFVAPSLLFMNDNVVTPVGRELNRNVRIPLLWQLRLHNVPYHVANWFANREGKIRGWWNDVDYMDPNNDIAKGIRQSLYRRWNSKAGYLLRSKSWEPRARQAALDLIQTSMNTFNKWWRPSLEKEINHSIDLRTPESYLKDFEFGYLPFDKYGNFWKLPNNKVGLGRAWRHPGKAGSNLYVNANPKRSSTSPVNFNNTIYDAIHEGEHAFKLDPILNKLTLNKVGDRISTSLNNAYETSYHPLRSSDSADFSEKAATNAEVLHFLKIKPEEASTLPTERIIRIDPKNNNRVQTIFSDMIDSKNSSSYLKDYHENTITKLDKLKDENNLKGIGGEETFRNFAEEFANFVREALKVNYKKGGKI